MRAARKVFDTHFHIGTWGTREFFGSSVTPLGPARPDRYVPGMEHHSYRECLAYLDAYQIDHGLVVCNYLAPDPRYSLIDLNKVALEAAAKTDRIYAGIFVSPLPQDWEYTEEALTWADRPGVKVIKFTSTHWMRYTVHPRTWDMTFRRNMEQILAVARKFKLVLHFHTGHLNSTPEEFDGFLREFGRDHMVQLVHSGESVYPSFQFVSFFPKWLAAGYDVYCDTSMCPGFVLPWLLRTLEQHPEGYNRILFATDSPWGNFLAEYWKVESLDISDELKHKIFWANADHLYHHRVGRG